MPSVTTTAKRIASEGLVQNLGPDPLYLGPEGVTSANGFRVRIGEAVAVGTPNEYLWGVSSGTSDVRILGRGTMLVATPTS